MVVPARRCWNRRRPSKGKSMKQGICAPRARLWLAIASTFFVSAGTTQAREVIGGSPVDVRQGDIPEDWALSSGATLRLLPGATAYRIDARGSRVEIGQAGVEVADGIALRLSNNASATIVG